MAETDEKGVSIEVLGTCMTNTTADSQHDAKVEYRHLWSYAQQAALIAVSDNNTQDGCYHLITDPERRAKRIAAHYAFLYFESARKSKGKVQFYWPALAAFVVKDIVEAYRFTREEVLQRQWKDLASVARNSSVADLGSLVMTSDSPYQHALRTYAALAKGNLWLFMDIYPWLWFFSNTVLPPMARSTPNGWRHVFQSATGKLTNMHRKKPLKSFHTAPRGWRDWLGVLKAIRFIKRQGATSRNRHYGVPMAAMGSTGRWHIALIIIVGRT